MNDTETLAISEFLKARYVEAYERAVKCTAAWPTEAEKVYDEVYRVALPTHDEQEPDEWDVRIRREEALHVVAQSPAFVLEDIMSKRAIVDHVEDWLKGIPDAGTHEAAETVLRLLAVPYRTHPHYQEEWA